MAKMNFLKDLAEKISESLPSNIGTLKSDVEKNCHEILQSAFKKMDLITRQEFDNQSKVLVRTRKKLEALEIQVAELEQLLLKRKHKS